MIASDVTRGYEMSDPKTDSKAEYKPACDNSKNNGFSSIAKYVPKVQEKVLGNTVTNHNLGNPTPNILSMRLGLKEDHSFRFWCLQIDSF